MIVEYILVVFKVVLNWDNLLFWCKYHVTNLFITDNSRECFALANQSLRSQEVLVDLISLLILLLEGVQCPCF